MELTLIVLLISTSEDVAFVRGDVGTVTSYSPPYTRKFDRFFMFSYMISLIPIIDGRDFCFF